MTTPVSRCCSSFC